VISILSSSVANSASSLAPFLFTTQQRYDFGSDRRIVKRSTDCRCYV
jgi:hypothetical protein